MENIFIEPFEKFMVILGDFLPTLMTGIVIVIVGALIAWILKTVFYRIAVIMKIDSFSERLGVVQILQKGGFKEPLSKLVSRLIFWMVLALFIIMGLDSLKMPAVENLLSEFLLYLPNVILACIVVFVGYLLGNFLGRAALIASVNAGLSFSGIIGKFVKFTVFVMTATMAMELLGIGEETVLVAFAIVFGGVVLALSLAFGLGGRDAAKAYIEKILSERKDEDDIHHI
jgi:glucose-6-phosphate-specific signal transduction histidine kinase